MEIHTIHTVRYDKGILNTKKRLCRVCDVTYTLATLGMRSPGTLYYWPEYAYSGDEIGHAGGRSEAMMHGIYRHEHAPYFIGK